MLSSGASWSTSANIFREWCANCNYSWRAQHYRGQLYDNVMSPISIIVTFPCLELTAHHTNLFFSLGKWSLKWNCTKMRRNLGSWWLDIISYCPAPRQFNFRVKTAQKYNWTLMFSADPRCVLEQGTFYQNRMIPSVALFTFYSNSCCHGARPGCSSWTALISCQLISPFSRMRLWVIISAPKAAGDWSNCWRVLGRGAWLLAGGIIWWDLGGGRHNNSSPHIAHLWTPAQPCPALPCPALPTFSQ